MNCNIVSDLIPLYIDGCCSDESEKIVKEHIETCDSCRKLFENMKTPTHICEKPKLKVKFSKLEEWKASVLQSVMLFVSFVVLTIGVALESKTPIGEMNGFWAVNLVIPATGFLLSLANWYFVRLYKNRKIFTNCSFLATLGITACAYIWSAFHYGVVGTFDTFLDAFSFCIVGVLLTVVLCVLSKILAGCYAKMLGKE